MSSFEYISSWNPAGTKEVKMVPGFQRMKVEPHIWLWSASSLKVVVRRRGPSIPLPRGYSPKFRSSRVIIDGPGLDALLEARRQRDALLARQDSPLRQAEEAARNTTVEQTYEMMMANLRSKVSERNRREATVRSYASHWPVLRSRFGDGPLGSVTPADVQLWLDGQRGRVGPRTRWHYRQTLGRVFNFAATRGLYALRNPVELTEPVELPVDDRGRRLTERETADLLEACWGDGRRAQFWFSFFAVMALTGLRYMECSRLKWEDAAPQDGLVVPNHQKSRKRRDALVLSPELQAVLEAWAPESRSGLIFPSSTRRPVTYKVALTALKRIASRAGISQAYALGLHCFRRMNTTVAQAESRGDVMSFLTVVRHRDLGVSRRYTPALPAQAVKLSLKTSMRLGKVIGLKAKPKAGR